MNTLAFIDAALDEDIGPGDVTTLATVPLSREGRGVIVAKQALVVCGQELARRVFARLSERMGAEVRYLPLVPDGAAVRMGDEIAHLEGSLATLLVGERLALNLLMKLSGIATTTRRHVDAAGPTGPRVVDTRKTTPLLRDLEKDAVRCGGGVNHRRALYDGVMIKDNHIAAVGSIADAVAAVRRAAHHLLKVEVEVTDLDELQQALDAGADVLLLDNMGDDQLAEAVALARALRPEVTLEASGNMNPERIRAIRDLDLDVISVGGVIHQATWVDLSMRITG
ncbi:MAG: carboxylating nicotinate-nucleotide diphosphorylase [Deltaproteobacteria bacterium]|nr:carboxylating nicotinate-nucleotide diphosphorylase [Deltaproteobacteria bacterium]